MCINQIRKVQILRVKSARSSSNQAEQHHGSFSDHQALEESDDLSCSKNRNGIEIRWNLIPPFPPTKKQQESESSCIEGISIINLTIFQTDEPMIRRPNGDISDTLVFFWCFVSEVFCQDFCWGSDPVVGGSTVTITYSLGGGFNYF